ncbi:hypothetical protein HHSLTHF2_27570 [Vreelandella venusta]|uniref:Uncharacterized protein n=1 Tax=Halomonas hydrothermalis TaxID=115561 RepID=A0A6F8U5C3_9GAMM|nr:hypothetical protein HHSLTHF2_27570 [Halomonas hydrothermalis]
MANSREAQLQWEITKDMTDRGWMAGTAVGYVLKDEYVSELERPHYRLTKRVEECLRLEVAGKDTTLLRSTMSALASPTTPRSCTTPTASPTVSNATKR